MRQLGLELAGQLVKDQEGERRVSDSWEQRVRQLLALARWRTSAATTDLPLGAVKNVAPWQIVNRPTAQVRGEGYAPPVWLVSKDKVEFAAGQARDALYFAAPLRGNFELRWEQAGGPSWRALRPLYAATAFDFDADKHTVQRHPLGTAPLPAAPLPEPIKPLGDKTEYRLVVQNGTLSIVVNGQKLISEPIAADADPWLAIDTRKPSEAGAVQNVRILGEPTIPREVRLSAPAGLLGWSPYYGEPPPREGQAAAWAKIGDEITAPQLPAAEGSFRESVLQYHRPLLEDGEVECEFYYEPGKTEVHPALDRAVFLLRSEGVQLHWLTDAQYDRTGISPDNAQPIPGAKPVPLKAGRWNQLRVTVSGDEATIAVNGVEVARRKLEANNRRILGLFHFADASGVRVRNVVLRGQWPLSLAEVVAK
jgi:hypothetical protein